MKGWNSRTHSRLRREERSSFKTLIAHYDFIRGPDQAADRNLMDSLLAAAEHASCVTLWAALDVLIARIDERHRLEDKAQDGIRSEEKPQGDSRTRAIYSDPSLHVARFEAWFAIAAQYPVEHHWIIDTTMPNLRVLPLDAWPELRERMLDTAPA